MNIKVKAAPMLICPVDIPPNPEGFVMSGKMLIDDKKAVTVELTPLIQRLINDGSLIVLEGEQVPPLPPPKEEAATAAKPNFRRHK
jgi:hypothetical protein